MKYLNFHKAKNGKSYDIVNSSDVIIGVVRKIRNGRFLHWSLVIPPELMEEILADDCLLTFSPGCLDEIREFCKKLNGGQNGK